MSQLDKLYHEALQHQAQEIQHPSGWSVYHYQDNRDGETANEGWLHRRPDGEPDLGDFYSSPEEAMGVLDDWHSRKLI